jgi:Arc-like DNA binding domain.
MAKQDDFFKMQVRIPMELYEQLKESSDESFRSLNAEIIYLLSVCMGNKATSATPEQVREIVADVVKSELAKAGK